VTQRQIQFWTDAMKLDEQRVFKFHYQASARMIEALSIVDKLELILPNKELGQEFERGRQKNRP